MTQRQRSQLHKRTCRLQKLPNLNFSQDLLYSILLCIIVGPKHHLLVIDNDQDQIEITRQIQKVVHTQTQHKICGEALSLDHYTTTMERIISKSEDPDRTLFSVPDIRKPTGIYSSSLKNYDIESATFSGFQNIGSVSKLREPSHGLFRSVLSRDFNTTSSHKPYNSDASQDKIDILTHRNSVDSMAPMLSQLRTTSGTNDYQKPYTPSRINEEGSDSLATSSGFKQKKSSILPEVNTVPLWPVHGM